MRGKDDRLQGAVEWEKQVLQITVGNGEVRTMFLLIKNNLQQALFSVLAAVEAIVSAFQGSGRASHRIMDVYVYSQLLSGCFPCRNA